MNENWILALCIKSKEIATVRVTAYLQETRGRPEVPMRITDAHFISI